MLKKLFIKNYQNVDDPEVRNMYGVVSGAFGITTNIILFIIKLIIGLIANSVTIMADAFNNLSDSLSSIITILGFKLANRPADSKHPYGHARYEQITGIIVAFLIFAMGIIFAKTSIEKMINPEEITLSIATYLVLIVAIIGKLIQMGVYLDFAKEINSKVIKANALDARNDVISTLAVLIAMVIMGVFNVNIDAYMGFIVSIFIVISAIKMLKETIDPLLGIMPTPKQVKEISDRILAYEGVEGIHDLMIHNYGAGKDFITVHVEVSSDMNIVVAHDLADNIEKDFRDNLNINLTIHMDPLDVKDETVKRLRKKVSEILKKFDPEINFHDFRVVTGKSHSNIIFDIVVPFEKDYSKQVLKDLLEENFKDENQKYYFVLNVEKPFYAEKEE